MSNHYSNTPLQLNDIRVLLLHSCQNYEASVSCDLVVTSHDLVTKDATLQYEALSYTWGPPYDGYDSLDGTILLCGEEKAVKGNLRDALKHFRLPGVPRNLWIDALCINQDDEHERTAQVARMAPIYSRASSVLIWLGEDSRGCDAEMMIPLYHSVIKHKPDFVELKRILEVSPLGGRLQTVGVPQEERDALDEKMHQLCARSFDSYDHTPLVDAIQGRIEAGSWFRDHTDSHWLEDGGGHRRHPFMTFLWPGESREGEPR